MILAGNRKFEFVKGAMTVLGLYAKLYEFSNSGNVVVFDDCDSVLLDDLALNIQRRHLIVVLDVEFIGTSIRPS